MSESPTTIGSILDLLPRRSTVEYNALPKFIRDEIDLLRNGGRPVAPADLKEVLELVTALPDRIAALGREMRVENSLTRDALKANTASNAELAKALTSLEKEQAASRVWIKDHEKRLDAHDVVIGVHAKKHVQHATEITGVIKRLVVVEEAVVTKRPTRRKKAKTRK